MSAEAREIGMKWMTNKLQELTQKGAVPVNVHWEANITNENAQILEIETPGLTKKWEIANLDLEDETRRAQLERVIQAVANSVGNEANSVSTDKKQEKNSGVQERSLPLTAQEQQVLVETLNTAIPPLREEIVRAADDHAYRDVLREKERLINVILEKLDARE